MLSDLEAHMESQRLNGAGFPFVQTNTTAGKIVPTFRNYSPLDDLG